MDACMMLNDFEVVHLSKTPLVGAPGKISRMLNDSGVSSISFCEMDYPEKSSLNNKFIGDSILLSDFESGLNDFFQYKLRSADVIHLHNQISTELLSKIKRYALKAKFIYQVHSPLREGPLFVDRTNDFGLPFSKKLVVAQYQPRQYADYQLVPNVVLDRPSLRLRNDDELLRVVFSPSHNRDGRWNAKMAENLEETLVNLAKNNKISLFMPKKPVSPSELMLVREFSDVSIDEISTGAYHQISLEGMCKGNVVINRADYFSREMLRVVSRAQEQPPFLYSDSDMIFDVILDLSYDVVKTNALKKDSFQYFLNNLTPNNLVKNFVEIYYDVI